LDERVYACKHRLHHTYYFTYTEEDLKWTFEKWQFNNCRANPKIYLRTFDEEETEKLGDGVTDGQVVSVKYRVQDKHAWQGKVKLKKWYEVINLTRDWVHANFQGFAIEQWVGSPNKWHKIIPGRARDPDRQSSPILYATPLHIQYPQGNLHTCMVSSFASCLYHYGLKKASERLIHRIGQLYVMPTLYNEFQKIVMQATNNEFSVIRDKRYNFDQDEELFNMPTLVILTGNDGTSNHAISVYKDMIFDSSHNKILKRCRENLDWCCGDMGFQKIDHAYTLREEEDSNKKQKIN